MLFPKGMIPRNLRAVNDLLFSLGSSASTVRRSSVRSAPIPVSLSMALTGRSRKRFDAPAASAISLRPIAVSWSTFLPNSGLLLSSAASSSTNLATLLSSSEVSSFLSGTSPDASAAGSGCSASGASSLILVVVAVPGSLAMLVILFLPVAPISGRWPAATQEALLYYRPKTPPFTGNSAIVVRRPLTSAMHGSLTVSGLAGPPPRRPDEVGNDQRALQAAVEWQARQCADHRRRLAADGRWLGGPGQRHHPM